MFKTSMSLALFAAIALNSLALDVPLTIQNPSSAALTAEPITSGAPFAEGVLTDSGLVRILNAAGTEIPAQFLTTARWPDGSVRWLLCDFQTDISGDGAAAVTLRTGTAPAPFSGIVVDNQSATLSVNTGAATFQFDKTAFRVQTNAFTVAYGGTTYTATPSGTDWVIEESGPMKVVVRVDGTWRRSNGAVLRDELIRFRARLFFYYNKNTVRASLTFRNNNTYGWDSARQPDLNITAIAFGSVTLPISAGPYVFGSGVEKTFETIVSSSGTVTRWDVRYDAQGHVAAGYYPDRPLAVAPPSYYASTMAWGRAPLPITGLAADTQADFDRYEKLQRAKVIPGDVENPQGQQGITIWQHLVQDIGDWRDYGDQRWAGNGAGWWSGNHYDWVYGSYLHLFRTGRLPFANLARIMARHEIDMDIYHTTADGNAYNEQKDWEERESHDNPGNSFGPGRPSHTWCQGYALHWLVTGDPRGRDAFEEILDGVRLYVYESFNADGYCSTNEIRVQGWLTDNLVTLWRVAPQTVWTVSTSSGGTRTRTIPQAIRDVLQNVFDRETTAGNHGYVYGGDDWAPNPNLRAVIQHCYFVEPAAKAYDDIFSRNVDPEYGPQLLGLVTRMTRFIHSMTYGGETSGSTYLPFQIPFAFDVTHPDERDGQIPYLLMYANAAGFCYLNGGDAEFLTTARVAFRDYIRYFGVAGPNSYIDPALRTPTAYNNDIYGGTNINDGTLSKVQGWSGRFGMFFLAAERVASDSFRVEFVAGAGGTLTGETAQTVVSGGDCSPVTAVPNAERRFVKWTKDGADYSVANPLTVTNVTENMTFEAEFEPDTPYPVHFLAGTGGSLTGETSQDVDSGGDCSPVTAIPSANYRFARWSRNGAYVGVANPLTVRNVTAPATYLAEFQSVRTYHSADYNPADWKIDVFELLRVVNLFNNGHYYQVNAAGPDGFNPSATRVDFAPWTYHNADYNPTDGQIDVSELSRVIILFNNGLYYKVDAATPDGFAPSDSLPVE